MTSISSLEIFERLPYEGTVGDTCTAQFGERALNGFPEDTTYCY